MTDKLRISANGGGVCSFGSGIYEQAGKVGKFLLVALKYQWQRLTFKPVRYLKHTASAERWALVGVLFDVEDNPVSHTHNHRLK